MLKNLLELLEKTKALREAQKTYMADRGNDEKGKAVADTLCIPQKWTLRGTGRNQYNYPCHKFGFGVTIFPNPTLCSPPEGILTLNLPNPRSLDNNPL